MDALHPDEEADRAHRLPLHGDARRRRRPRDASRRLSDARHSRSAARLRSRSACPRASRSSAKSATCVSRARWSRRGEPEIPHPRRHPPPRAPPSGPGTRRRRGLHAADERSKATPSVATLRPPKRSRAGVTTAPRSSRSHAAPRGVQLRHRAVAEPLDDGDDRRASPAGGVSPKCCQAAVARHAVPASPGPGEGRLAMRRALLLPRAGIGEPCPAGERTIHARSRGEEPPLVAVVRPAAPRGRAARTRRVSQPVRGVRAPCARRSRAGAAAKSPSRAVAGPPTVRPTSSHPESVAMGGATPSPEPLRPEGVVASARAPFQRPRPHGAGPSRRARPRPPVGDRLERGPEREAGQGLRGHDEQRASRRDRDRSRPRRRGATWSRSTIPRGRRRARARRGTARRSRCGPR